MKLSKEQLKQIIKEEIETVLSEELESIEETDNPTSKPKGRFYLYGNPMSGKLEFTIDGTTRWGKGTLRQWRLNPQWVYEVLGNPANNNKKIKEIDPKLAAHLATIIKDEDLKEAGVFDEFELVQRRQWDNVKPY